VIVIIHFFEQVKFSKVRSPATYLPHPSSSWDGRLFGQNRHGYNTPTLQDTQTDRHAD